MDVVGHVIQKYILLFRVGVIKEQMQLFRRSKTVVRLDVTNGPIAVVSGEGTYGSTLVPKAPSIFWILCDWTDPKRVGV